MRVPRSDRTSHDMPLNARTQAYIPHREADRGVIDVLTSASFATLSRELTPPDGRQFKGRGGLELAKRAAGYKERKGSGERNRWHDGWTPGTGYWLPEMTRDRTEPAATSRLPMVLRLGPIP